MKLTKNIAFAVLALAAVAAGGVKAAIDHAHIVTYYADPELNYIVGESGRGCHSAFKWGDTSPYFTVEEFSCF